MKLLPDISGLSADAQTLIRNSYRQIGEVGDGELDEVNAVLENVADLLDQSGMHNESRDFYNHIYIQSNDLLAKARLLRKISASFNAQREYQIAQQVSEEALLLMRQAHILTENIPELFETLTVCAYANYFASKPKRLHQLIAEMRSYFPGISDQSVRLRFYFVVMLNILLRNRWYMLPEEAITHGEFYLQLALETKNWNTIATAYSGLAFCHLWREEFEVCRKKFEVAFDYLQNRNYDLLLTAQVYTAVSFRMQNNISMTERWTAISKEVAEKSNNINYQGLVYANLAWINAKRNNLLYAEEFAKKGFEICLTFRNPMLYLCIFPLLKCLLKGSQYDDAGGYNFLLLHPSLKSFPEPLNEKISAMNAAWVEGRNDLRCYLEDVVTEAELSNYF